MTWILLFAVTCQLGDAPQQDVEPLNRILFGSCVKQDRPAPIFDRIVGDRPDLFLFLGDNIYADTDDLQLMQRKYAQLANIEGFKTLRSTCPILATWDDHDYGANDAGADFAARRGSQRVFLDFWQDAADSPRRKREGVYLSRTFGPRGRRVQVILLDTRYFRSPLDRGAERRVGGPYVPTNDTARTMLGTEQWKWLSKQLKQPAELRLIVSSVQFVAAAAGQETWSNLPHERTRMLELIRDTAASGVVFISGDRHWSELSRSTDIVRYPIYDLTSSSLNQKHPRGTPTENRFRFKPQTFHEVNYGVIEIDWEDRRPSILLQIRDAESKVRIEHRIHMDELRGG